MQPLDLIVDAWQRVLAFVWNFVSGPDVNARMHMYPHWSVGLRDELE